jgi:hypothetical protein
MKVGLYTITGTHVAKGMKIEYSPILQLIINDATKIPIRCQEEGVEVPIQRYAHWLLVEDGRFIFPEREMNGASLNPEDLVLIAWVGAPSEELILCYDQGVKFTFFNQGNKNVLVILMKMKSSIIWCDGRFIDLKDNTLHATVDPSQVYD